MEERLPRKLAAILYADVAGYSRLTGEDEDATHRTLSEFLDIISSAIESYRGQVMHYAGDAVLAKFDAVVDAMSSAIAIQNELTRRNADLPPGRRVEFRIGVNLGDVIEDRGDIYGDGVNVGARLESLSNPGGICISESVRTTIGKKLDLDYEDMGEQKVKNIEEPIRAFRVVIEEKKGPASTTTSSPALELPDKPSIAVLPFTNMSGDPEQEYFSDGITEDIITELSRFRSIVVIARTSTFTYKGRSVPVQKIGKELGVAYVLEGSVRKAGDRVRINAQLVETLSGKHVWAERFDRDLTDIFELQDEITTLIVGALEPELGQAERSLARRRPPESLDAWGHYQRGLDHMYKRTAQGDASAEREFRSAIELDAEFAAPLAALAYTRAQVLYQLPPDDVYSARMREAIQFATQAIALDPGDALAFCALGRALNNSREFERGHEASTTAVQLNPSSATCRRNLGYSLLHSGDAKASIPEFELALKMSPRDPERWSFCHGIALAHLADREFEDALVWVERAVSAPNPGSWALVTRAAILGCLGRKEDARAALVAVHERVRELSVANIRHLWSRLSRSSVIDVMCEGLALAGLRYE